MAERTRQSVSDVLLTRRGVVHIPGGSASPPDRLIHGLELELAEIGYVVSTRLRERLSTCSPEELKRFLGWAVKTLLSHIGGDRKHVPLFRRFPEGVPDDTFKLWLSKVLVHFLQAEGQACLFCGRRGTTHVLDPCLHVVCEFCFDGSNYSACPVCEHHINGETPFLKPGPERPVPDECVVFKRIDLCDDLGGESRCLFDDLCSRTQALSPDDRDILTTLLGAYGARVLEWLPAQIPLRENIAVIFGTLFGLCDPDEVLPHARRYLSTATDVLRFIAVLSGTDGSLQRETVIHKAVLPDEHSRFIGAVAKLLGRRMPGRVYREVYIPTSVHRFKIAKLSRALRRALLEILEGIEPELLAEDMLRHRSYWVWVGQFLHPHEYAKRYPKAAHAFKIIRKKSPGGEPAPEFKNWYSRLDQARRVGDLEAMLTMLVQRPGEFARRYDHTARLAGDHQADIARVVDAFVPLISALATPVLLTLRSHLPLRRSPAGVRVYWPKGRIAMSPSDVDTRAPLPAQAIDPVVESITDELLKRFGTKSHHDQGLIDRGLSEITVPFNERTASASAVSLPRGSVVSVHGDKVARLFLHWCEPRHGGSGTDLDLSVALYDADWRYVGVCSYYELKLKNKCGETVALSAGDLQDAPWPKGATEFVDLHLDAARALEARYAVMVINSYAGMPFSELDQAFAGLMFRGDTGGTLFDPRTVELKFQLDGANGTFIPLVFDLESNRLHWLDVQSRGEFQFNNVENSRAEISRICPNLIHYFGSGTRPSMFELASLHAAARCKSVVVREYDGGMQEYHRRPEENSRMFYDRLVESQGGESLADLPDYESGGPLAFMLRGDRDIPTESGVFVLFPEQVTSTMAASDLCS